METPKGRNPFVDDEAAVSKKTKGTGGGSKCNGTGKEKKSANGNKVEPYPSTPNEPSKGRRRRRTRKPTHWLTACRQCGYLTKGAEAKSIPKKGTPEYGQIVATMERLKREAANN